MLMIDLETKQLTEHEEIYKNYEKTPALQLKILSSILKKLETVPAGLESCEEHSKNKIEIFFAI